MIGRPPKSTPFPTPPLSRSQGFINRRIPLWLRRLITMLPALVVLAIGLNPSRSLVISQVVLSFGIPFALIPLLDRKSTRLNSSHANISYAVFCLKKKKKTLHLSILILLHAYGDASHIAYLRIRLLYSASQLHTP